MIYPLRGYVEAGGDVPRVRLIETRPWPCPHVRSYPEGQNLPIFQPTKFELAVSLQAEKAPGPNMAPELLIVTDEAIERGDGILWWEGSRRSM
jgi:hypothetical protein